jgi:hypothetical protein
VSGGFAARFVLELAFLALLALAAGLAELDTPWIVAVMVVGWLLVVAIEWLAWRAEHAEADEGVARAEPVTDEDADWQPEDILAPLPGDDER